MIDDKNQIMRSMRSYQEGSASDDSCMEEYTDFDGKRKRRRKKGGCGKVTKSGQRSIPEGVKKVVKGVATGVGLGAAYVKREAIKAFAKDKLGMQKKGGAVKRTTKKK
jgi:hypothetical protein